MGNIFLDTNFFFDITERDIQKQNLLSDQKILVSALSYHILFYSYKHKVPNKLIIEYKKQFQTVDLTDQIFTLALEGPTTDLEDNIQLHSAAEAECDIFLTNDRKLLKMKFFGKTKIASTP